MDAPGVASSIPTAEFTRVKERGQQFFLATAGTVWVNCYHIVDTNMPFGSLMSR
jgi:hypothetical protein